MPFYVLREWEIRRRLDSAGITLRDAAALLGVNRATFSTQVNGVKPVSLGVVVGLADLFGVDNVRELIEVAPEDIAPKNGAGLALSNAGGAG